MDGGKMKRNILILLYAALIIFMSGCRQKDDSIEKPEVETGKSTVIEDNSDTGKENIEETEIPELNLIKNGDRITRKITQDILLDAEIELPDEGMNSVGFYQIITDGFDGGKILPDMIGRMPDTTTVYEEQKDDKAFVQPWQPNGGNFITYLYSGKMRTNSIEMDGTILTSLGLSYYTDHWDFISASFPISQYENGISFYLPQKEHNFSFASQEEAVEICQKYLEETIGLGSIRLLKTYSFSYEELQEYEEKRKQDPAYYGGAEAKPEEEIEYEWSENDNCYWIFFEQLFEGIPVLSNQVTRQDLVYIPSCMIQVGYTENGIEYIRIDNHYETLKRENVELLSLEEIFNSLQRKFEMSIVTENIISEMKLIYYPMPTNQNADGLYECDMIPVWQFGMKETIGGDEYTNYTYIDARNGIEIVG